MFRANLVIDLVTAVLLLVTSTSHCLDTGTERFPSYNSVRIRASRINNQHATSSFVTHEQPPQALFPSLTFKCSGSIAGIWYVARVTSPTSATVSPTFQVWRKNPPRLRLEASTSYQLVQEVNSIADSTGFSPDIRLMSIETSFFDYQEGDVFGTSMSSSVSRFELLYSPNGGPTAYFGISIGLSGTTQFNLSQEGIVNDNDYPLIAVKTDHPECVEGFLDISVLETLLANVVSYPGQLRVIPQLRFPCSGSISGFIIGGKRGMDVTESENLRVGLWSCTTPDSVSEKACERVNIITISSRSLRPLLESPNVYVIMFEGFVWQVSQAYAIGIEQGAATENNATIYYQQGIGPTNYYSPNVGSSSTGRISLSNFMSQKDLPLLYPLYDAGSGGTGVECANNFIDLDTLKRNALLIHPIFTNIVPLTETPIPPNEPPISPTETPIPPTETPISPTESSIPPTESSIPPIETPTSRTEKTISPSESPSEAVFTTRPASTNRTRRLATAGNTGYQYFFPHLSFQLSGLLISWVFAASRVTSQNGNNTYPQFQVWRPIGEHSYKRINTTDPNVAPIAVPGELNVYEYNFEAQPVAYLQGDVVGIYQPPLQSSPLQVAFVNDDLIELPGTIRIPVNTEPALEYDLSIIIPELIGMVSPVLTVEAIPLPISTPTPNPTSILSESASTTLPDTIVPTSRITGTTTTITTTPDITETDVSTTGDPGVTSPQGGISDVAIAGSAVGGVVVLLLLLVFLLVVCICVMNRRRKAGKTTVTMFDAVENPEYSHVNNDAQLYEVPISTIDRDVPQRSSAIYQTVGETPQLYETPSITRRTENQQTNADGDNVYHILEPNSMAGDSTGQDANHLYHVLEATKNNTPNPGRGTEEFEMSVVVPTGEQRKTLKRNDGRDLYASLRVVQSQTSSLKSDGSFFEESSVYWKPGSNPEQIYQQLSSKKYREIPRNTIQVTDHIGSGHFGNVNKGLWQTSGGSKQVAIKRLKDDPSNDDRVKFLQEAAVNGQFRHPNVVKLLGVVTIGEPVMIILELMENGDLRSYLSKHKPAPGEMVPPDLPQMLLGFCQHIVAGMDYLSQKGFVHRDLAARNILVTGNKTCKVTDFGMSREIEEESYYVSKGGAIPVRWTAPEAINYKKFSTASDVWSYGCVMYEVWSLGRKPFPKHNNLEVVKLIEEGYRLPPPPGCPREIYRVMIKCWHSESDSRPMFAELLDSLLRPESELLSWDEDKEMIKDNPRATVLGSSLKFSKDLYPELQNTYKSIYEMPNVFH